MSTDDQRAIIHLDRERYMASIQTDLNIAWQAALSLPEDDPRREQALVAIQNTWETNNALASLFQDAESTLAAAFAAATELRGQRDQAVTELGDLVTALENVWQSNDPRVQRAYNEIIEAHDAAFWQSLPYDMADSLGGQWNFMDADLLHYILTTDIDEIAEDGSDNGFTPDQIAAFRANLLTFLKAFTTRAVYPSLPEGDRHEDV